MFDLHVLAAPGAFRVCSLGPAGPAESARGALEAGDAREKN